MSKYQKRPVVVDAFQLTAENMRQYTAWPAWLTALFTQVHRGEPMLQHRPEHPSELILQQSSTSAVVHVGDWVVRYKPGYMGVYSSHAFDKKFVVVEE